MYEQGTDVRLLTSLLPGLASKIVIDAGAERGGFTQAFLDRGAETVFAIEPFPPNANALRERFAAEPRVKVLPMALSERDGTAILHLIQDREGHNTSSYHSLARASDTALLQTVGELPVVCRSLASLVAEGELPRHAGILKIDAEGHDLAILRGMGALEAAAVMIEFWDDLPEEMGRLEFTLAEAHALLWARGYVHTVVVKRRDELETVEIGDVRTRPGDWGNAIFLHQAAFPQLPAALFEAASAAHAGLIDKALYYKGECEQRLKVIEGQALILQEQAAALDAQRAIADAQSEANRERLALIGEQVRSIEEHSRLIDEAQLSIKEHSRLIEEAQQKIGKLRQLLKPVRIGERIKRVFRPQHPYDIP